MPDLPDARDDTHPDAVIAGTLCLMSCYAQHPLPAFAARVADNLHRLAGAAALTAEFRAVCRRMARRWSSIEDEAREGGRVARSADASMIAFAALRAMAEGRDPETLIGPLFCLFTRIAAARDVDARGALADHLTILAAHPAIDPQLRLAAGALALEHRSFDAPPTARARRGEFA